MLRLHAIGKYETLLKCITRFVPDLRDGTYHERNERSQKMTLSQCPWDPLLNSEMFQICVEFTTSTLRTPYILHIELVLVLWNTQQYFCQSGLSHFLIGCSEGKYTYVIGCWLSNIKAPFGRQQRRNVLVKMRPSTEFASYRYVKAVSVAERP